MTTIRTFCCNDLLRFSSTNLDHLTYTFEMELYMQWMCQRTQHFMVAVAPGNRIMGYVVGLLEDHIDPWTGYIYFLTVHPEYRRQKLGTKLVRMSESLLLDKIQFEPDRLRVHFVCTYVGVSNTPAKKAFEEFGYVCLRKRREYYFDFEDAFDMRKALVEEGEMEFSWLMDLRKKLNEGHLCTC